MLMHTSTFNNFPNFLTFCSCFETYLWSQKWLHITLIQVLRRQRLVDLCAWGQCGLHTISREIRALTQRSPVIKQSKTKQNTPPKPPKSKYSTIIHPYTKFLLYLSVDELMMLFFFTYSWFDELKNSNKCYMVKCVILFWLYWVKLDYIQTRKKRQTLKIYIRNWFANQWPFCRLCLQDIRVT